MNKIVIELMKDDDIKDVSEVERKSFTIPWSEKSFRREIDDNKVAVYLVAKADNKAVGYIGVWKIINEGHITNVAVHPDFRKMGIARMLVDELLSLCKKDGIDAFTLEVRRSNLVARHLYESIGFKEEGVRTEYYKDNNEDAIIMWKRD